MNSHKCQDIIAEVKYFWIMTLWSNLKLCDFSFSFRYNNSLKVKLLQRLAPFLVGRSRAYYYREDPACICLTPGVAVSFLPQIKRLFFFWLPNPIFFPPTPPPGRRSPNSKAVLQTGPESSENHWQGPASGFLGRKEREEDISWL